MQSNTQTPLNYASEIVREPVDNMANRECASCGKQGVNSTTGVCSFCGAGNPVPPNTPN
ncbi:hypothetical protein AA313_de0200871 [Arthrobotrys entomopaga]|nr:hypothetical protein AA313_de0200871 [Arthrobotrys entomopaga]